MPGGYGIADVMRKRRAVVELPAVRRRPPVFSRACVCCDGDSYNRSQIVAQVIEVPVCGFCHEHAIGTPRSALWLAITVVVGTAMIAFGLAGVTRGPGAATAGMLIGVGVTLFGIAAVWGRWELRHRRDLRHSGHHLGLAIEAGPKHTLVWTTNDRLADELVAANPGARRKVDRGLGRGAIPEARLLGAPAEPAGDAERQRMVDEILGPPRRD
jgi:hypothetical protein